MSKNSSTPAKRVLTLLLSFLFFLSFFAYLLLDLVSNQLLNPAIYTNALSQNHIYDRVYTDLLAEPALVNATSQLLGNINLADASPGIYSLAVSTLYLILPPTDLQHATEDVIHSFTDFLSGETKELKPRLNLTNNLDEAVLAKRTATALQSLIAKIYQTSAETSTTPEKNLNLPTLTEYMDNLSNGNMVEIPVSLTSVDIGSLSTSEHKQLTHLLLSNVQGEIPQIVPTQIQAALAGNDLETAISLAIQVTYLDRIHTSSKKQFNHLRSTNTFNTLYQTALTLETTKDNLVNSLNQARKVFIHLDNKLIPISIFFILLSLILIALLNRHAWHTAIKALGMTVTVTSSLILLIWSILGIYLSGLVSDFFLDNRTPSLPSLSHMLADTTSSVLSNLWLSVTYTLVITLLIGTILLFVTYHKNIKTKLDQLISPIQTYWQPIFIGTLVFFVIVVPLTKYISKSIKKDDLPCNGHVELCNRPLNEIAFASTHNGMSIAEYGWLWPSHDGDITTQLNYGIRGLLIDSHYFDAVKSIASYFPNATSQQLDILTEVTNQVGLEKRDGTYVCHMLCNIGNTPLNNTFSQIKTFIDDNPREVVILVIEDKISPENTATAFDDAGLSPYLYEHPPHTPWPTLRELINNDTRVVVFAEVEGSSPSKYHHFWDYAEETPYSFKDKSEFTCAPNRGNTGKDFFLLNHWIERVSPSRVDAVTVNDYEFLLSRARQCETERGKLPNFIAVNFFANGDIIKVVNRLNGVN